MSTELPKMDQAVMESVKTTDEKPPMVTDLDDPTDSETIENTDSDAPKKGDAAGLGKLSVEQLIVKTPNDRLSISAKSSVKELKCAKKSVSFDGNVFWLGVLQVFFGSLMMCFGVYAILHEAAMSLMSAGIWTGVIAISTGIFGVLATSKRCCPIEDRWRKLSHTLFLALSLISLALSQLVVVLAAIGLTRDLNNTENEEENSMYEATTKYDPTVSKFSIVIPENYLGILANVSLIVVSSLECICALFSSYKSAKALCPCFKKEKIVYSGLPTLNNSHALVSSWLGKHTPPPQLYVVTSTSTLGKGSKLSSGLPVTPVFTYPQMMPPQIVGVPLIPAPLGTIPSPNIPPNRKHPHLYSKHQSKSKICAHRPREKTPRPSRSRSRSRSKTREETLTEVDVAKTYTGLDKEIAEQFIERCETKKTACGTSSTKTSCDNSSSSSGPTTALSSYDSTTNSKDYLVK
ncbi:hypothetical protein WA026_001175 [Henosepilachna vigintioctopunctata]|uniref:Uncharacterized protein n=1 Tax=Henosepilachna vigintioctopunctata TaxID=420089 RepID=A0AAW1UHI9_9CUCU